MLGVRGLCSNFYVVAWRCWMQTQFLTTETAKNAVTQRTTLARLHLTSRQNSCVLVAEGESIYVCFGIILMFPWPAALDLRRSRETETWPGYWRNLVAWLFHRRERVAKVQCAKWVWQPVEICPVCKVGMATGWNQSNDISWYCQIWSGCYSPSLPSWEGSCLAEVQVFRLLLFIFSFVHTFVCICDYSTVIIYFCFIFVLWLKAQGWNWYNSVERHGQRLRLCDHPWHVCWCMIPDFFCNFLTTCALVLRSLTQSCIWQNPAVSEPVPQNGIWSGPHALTTLQMFSLVPRWKRRCRLQQSQFFRNSSDTQELEEWLHCLPMAKLQRPSRCHPKDCDLGHLGVDLRMRISSALDLKAWN